MTVPPRRAADILVACLRVQGIETVFGVPGESYLAVLDALHDSGIAFVPNRQEGGAAFMAEAWGKLTGQPGICFVTRGPGATNAAIGVHTARQNSTPMILFVGQVARDMRGREAFQEIDYRAMFGPVAKAVFEIDDPDRVAELVGRAMAAALSGRPGPVVVSLPEDMLTEHTDAAPLSRPVTPPFQSPKEGHADAEALMAAERPLILIGGGGWEVPGGRGVLSALATVAAEAGLPIAVGFRRQDLIDNTLSSYIGDAGVGMAAHVKRAIREADVLLALNIRFGETETDGYTLLDVPQPKQRLIHVHADAGELLKIFQTPEAAVADPAGYAGHLMRGIMATGAESTPGVTARARGADWAAELRAAFDATFTLPAQPTGVDMGAVMQVIREHLPADGIITTGAGNFAIWPARLFLYGPEHRLLAPQSGAMGYGLPAAIAAKLRHPGRAVVCFAGDGDIQMTMQELGTAMQAGAQPVVLVVNNGSYGTIRMHQERHYPGRVSATRIENPDYLAIGRAYGMAAARVERTEDFAPALQAALASPSGALIELVISTEALTPRETLSEMRNKALERAASGAG
ncbi:MAG: thiamine pyrophosphate-dependent enzyme [Pseudomonadota bacterium]